MTVVYDPMGTYKEIKALDDNLKRWGNDLKRLRLKIDRAEAALEMHEISCAADEYREASGA